MATRNQRRRRRHFIQLEINDGEYSAGVYVTSAAPPVVRGNTIDVDGVRVQFPRGGMIDVVHPAPAARPSPRPRGG